MRKIFISACLLSLFMANAHAQETYENTKLVDNDLNGTARYVGMGGAMEALGADISTISSNPAGIGLFRHSQGSVSAGLVQQDEAPSFKYGNKTNMSFDQIGFVYSYRAGSRSFANFAFNYHKSKNFDYILSAADNLNGSSQNRLSYIKALGDRDASGLTNINIENSSSGYHGTNYFTSQLDNLYYNALMCSQNGLFYNNASGYQFGRANTGYIGQYDLNMSGNLNDRVYLGMTIGIHDVHYKGQSLYTEQLLDANDAPAGNTTIVDDRRITGTGFNVGAGIIFRPIEASPFRIGLSVISPTWYDLTTSNKTYMVNGSNYVGANPKYTAKASYDYKVFTPWKFGVSAGTTVGRMLALGASYEYADYSRMDSRVNDGSYRDYWDNVYDNSYSDSEMNDHTKETLKGVSTVKMGAECKILDNFAVRVGYNYVSPMFKKEGFKNGGLDSYASNYSSATDYTNWKSTNRFTVGFGYSINKFAIDLAYQYSQTDGDFHPFMDAYTDYYIKNSDGVIEKNTLENYANSVKVSNKRNQLLLTLTYTL